MTPGYGAIRYAQPEECKTPPVIGEQRRPLWEQLERMERGLNALQVAVDLLSKRLNPVMMAQPTQNPGVTQSSSSHASSLASQIEAFNNILGFQVERLNEIESGVDL